MACDVVRLPQSGRAIRLHPQRAPMASLQASQAKTVRIVGDSYSFRASGQGRAASGRVERIACLAGGAPGRRFVPAPARVARVWGLAIPPTYIDSVMLQLKHLAFSLSLRSSSERLASGVGRGVERCREV